jgi:hypothetical protein
VDDAATTPRDTDVPKVEPLTSAAQIDGQAGVEADGESPPSAPRWVKAFGLIAMILVLLFVGLHLTGNAPLHTPSTGGAEHGMQAP